MSLVLDFQSAEALWFLFPYNADQFELWAQPKDKMSVSGKKKRASSTFSLLLFIIIPFSSFHTHQDLQYDCFVSVSALAMLVRQFCTLGSAHPKTDMSGTFDTKSDSTPSTVLKQKL